MPARPTAAEAARAARAAAEARRGDGGRRRDGTGHAAATPGRVGVATSDHAQQLTLLGRVAQSLGERTGLSLQATWRGTGGSVPPAVVTTPAGFFDDGVYDDPFASDLVGRRRCGSSTCGPAGP